MQVKDVAGVRLPARGTPQKQAQSAVRDGVLGKVVVDDEHVPSALHEVLAERAARVRGDILQRRRLSRRGVDDDGIVERAVRAERLHEAGDRARLLSDRDIDADDVLIFLIEDGVEGDGGLARAPVADDEFALPPADGEHTVDGKDARFQRLIDGLTVDDRGRGRFDGAVAFRHDLAHAVDGISERPHDAPQKALADGHARAALGTADGAPLRNGALVAEEDAAHALAL